jgi:hypothetical protein
VSALFNNEIAAILYRLSHFLQAPFSQLSQLLHKKQVVPPQQQQISWRPLRLGGSDYCVSRIDITLPDPHNAVVKGS